jgi:hypothetical protein
VYVSYDEFKGRVPLVRGDVTFEVAPQDFHNPRLRATYMTQSGGTTGAPFRVPLAFGPLAVSAAYELLAYEAQGFMSDPWVLWRGVMPDQSGINNVLRRAHQGSFHDRWYSPVVGRDQAKRLFKYRIATWLPVLMARSAGAPVPFPEPLRIEQAGVIADWLAGAIQAQGGAVVQTPVSCALRISLSGLEKGYDLSGATFVVAGEPITPGKAAIISSTGAKMHSNYSFTEMGRVGVGCARATDVTDVHVCEGLAAVIEHPRLVSGTDVTVPALNVTSVLPSAPIVMVNVEIDDYGVLESRSCGCQLGSIGETTHLSKIRSFRKFAGEGLTLLGSDIVKLLDEVLPERFGGSPLDYQLSEEEDEVGLTRFVLRVSPRVEVASDAEIIEVALAWLSTDAQQAYLVPVWRQAGTFRVERIEPNWANTGKLQPLDFERGP